MIEKAEEEPSDAERIEVVLKFVGIFAQMLSVAEIQKYIDERPSIATPLNRILGWHKMYLHIFREGWFYTGLPSAQELADQFFDGDLDQVTAASEALPVWVEAAYPKLILDSSIKTELFRLGRGETEETIEEGIKGMSCEAARVIKLAMWNSPDIRELRKEIQTQRIKNSGCLALFVAIGIPLITLGLSAAEFLGSSGF